MLRFLGRGSAFCPDNNSAFYVDGTALILLDLPMSSFHKLIGIGLEALSGEAGIIRHIYVLVTHTHSDHIGGIPMLAHYAFYMWNKLPVTVVAPDAAVAEDLHFFMDRLEGCDSKAYNIITADAFRYVKAVIPTQHTPQLAGRCFGYLLSLGDKDVIYTGDTATLSPFKPYLDKAAALYTEISSNRSPVHLYLKDVAEELNKIADAGTAVYLMHLDDEKNISDLVRHTPLQLATLYESKENPKPMNAEQTLKDIFSVSESLYLDMIHPGNADHSKIFAQLTELGRILTESDRASFWKWDRASHTLWTTTATGVERITIPDDTGLVGKALHEKKVLITNDPYSNPDFNQEVDKKTGYVTKSILVMPVANIEGEYIGAYQVINKLGGDGTYHEKEDCYRLSLAAMICGLALESDVFLEESHTDKLTNLKNRMGFFHDFAKKYTPALQDPGAKLALFICDIDKFKRVNDTYGHNIGDEVLKHVASILHDNRPENGDVYRWGGEEFIMIMPGEDMAGGAARAEKIRQYIEAHDCVTDTVTVHHTMSFGVTAFDRDKSIEDNISVADEKLYQAKETGRNRVIS